MSNKIIKINLFFKVFMFCFVLSLWNNEIVFANSIGDEVPENSKVYYELNGEKKYFETLKAAILAISDDKETTIYLIDDVDITECIGLGSDKCDKTLNSSKNIIIDGQNKYTIYRGKKSETVWYTAKLFDIRAGSSLSLNNLTINENNEWILNESYYNEALEKHDKVTDANAFVKSADSSPITTQYSIYNAGVLNLNKTIVKNRYGANGIIYANAGAQVKINDSNIIHNASTGSASLAYSTGNNTLVEINGNTIIDGNYASSNGGIFQIYGNSKVVINNGEIKNTKALNCNGVIAIMYNVQSTLEMNGGKITSNSGISGKNNGRNGMIYVHNGGKFVMNGGIIENNISNSQGAVDVVGHAASAIELNSGTIQHNMNRPTNSDASNVSIGGDYNFTIGKDMVINGNIRVSGNIVNNGTITGEVSVDLSHSQEVVAVSGEGTINGDIIIYYKENTETVMDDKISLDGDFVFVEVDTELVLKLDFSGGKDERGKPYKLVAVLENTAPQINVVPVLRGYTFEGWYFDKDLKEKYDNSAIVKRSTLYAAYTPNIYKTIWNVDGKEIIKEIKYGELVIAPESPIKDGYKFIGWKNYENNLIMTDKDITFTAMWEKIEKNDNPETIDSLVRNCLLLGFIFIINVVILIYLIFSSKEKELTK